MFVSVFGKSNVYASTRSLRDYLTIESFEYVANAGGWRDVWSTQFYNALDIYNGSTASKSANYLDLGGSFITGNQFQTVHSHQLVDDNNTRLLIADRDYKISITGISNTVLFKVYETGEVGYERGTIRTLQYMLYYTDGTQSETEYLSTSFYDYNQTTNTYSIIFDLTPDKDVQKVRFFVKFDYSRFNTYWYGKGHIYHEVYYGYNRQVSNAPNMMLSVQEQSEELGWLEKIWTSVGNWFQSLGENIGGFFTNLWNNLSSILQDFSEWQSNLFDSLGDWFTDLFDSITALPSKIWEKIETGLTNLFVPDDDFIIDTKDDWQDLLATRLGAVYQCATMTFDMFGDVMDYDESDAINIPETSIPVGDGQEFTFGPYDVNVVPDGFEFLATICKGFIGTVCTLKFVNGLVRRYDEVIGKTFSYN